MKKLKLRALDFDGAELLTKEQLKKILGGGMMGTGGSGTETDPATFPTGGDASCPDGEVPCKCTSGNPPVSTIVCVKQLADCITVC